MRPEPLLRRKDFRNSLESLECWGVTDVPQSLSSTEGREESLCNGLTFVVPFLFTPFAFPSFQNSYDMSFTSSFSVLFGNPLIPSSCSFDVIAGIRVAGGDYIRLSQCTAGSPLRGVSTVALTPLLHRLHRHWKET